MCISWNGPQTCRQAAIICSAFGLFGKCPLNACTWRVQMFDDVQLYFGSCHVWPQHASWISRRVLVRVITTFLTEAPQWELREGVILGMEPFRAEANTSSLKSFPLQKKSLIEPFQIDDGHELDTLNNSGEFDTNAMFLSFLSAVWERLSTSRWP